MGVTRQALVAGVLAVASLLSARGASADSRADAESAIERGIALRRKSMDAAALAEFRRAYAIVPTPRALAQIALAEASLARWVMAESDLLRAIAAEDEWIDRQRGALQVALKEIQGHLSTLELAGPGDSEVWIDGVRVAQLPVPSLRVPAKRLVVEVRAASFETERREVDAQAGAIVKEAFTLKPLSAALPGPLPAAAAPPPRDVVPSPAAPEPAGQHGPQHTLAWIAAGGAVVFLAGGVVSTLEAADAASKYNSGTTTPTCYSKTPPAVCADYVSRLNTAQTLEVVGYSAAGAAAIASVVLFLTAPRSADPRTARGRAWCLPGLGGVTCGVAY
jgi:hypothetical protein